MNSNARKYIQNDPVPLLKICVYLCPFAVDPGAFAYRTDLPCIEMRTTLTIDDETAMSLKDLAHRSGRPFKQVVNDALRKGVHALQNPEAKPYRLSPASLGAVRPGIGLEKASSLADELENAAIAVKLELRK